MKTNPITQSEEDLKLRRAAAGSDGKRAGAVRDHSVEILRIIACLMVLVTHVKAGMTADGMPDRRRILITVLSGDGVSLFWCILGCFYFRSGGDYGHLLRRTLKKIVLPMFLFCMVMFFFGGCLFDGLPLRESIYHSASEWRDLVVRGVLGGYCVIPRTEHLWYLLVYFWVILLFPALYGAKVLLSGEDIRRRSASFMRGISPLILIAVLFFLILLLNDISGNAMLAISHHGLNGAAGAVPMMVLGAVLYSRKERFTKNPGAALIGAALFAAVCLLWMETEYRILLTDPGYEARQCRICAYGYLKMLSIFLVVFGLTGFFRAGARGGKVIEHLGRLTFYVYLLHYPMLAFLERSGVKAWAEGLRDGSAAGEFLCPLVMASFLLLITLPFAELFMQLMNLINRAFDRRH